MASGDPVVEVLKVLPPAASYATLDVRVGGSTPTEVVEVWDFDAASIEYLDFLCRLSEDYDGGGLTFTLAWSATSATTGDVRWGIAVRAFPDDAEDLDSSHSYSFTEVDDTAPSAAGEPTYVQIALTDGAAMDSWLPGELAIVRVRRNGSHANDTMAGDAELWSLVGKET